MTDFFISYNKADRSWAEWIAWELERAGYTTVLQAWDFGAGSNFVLEMDRATRESDRTIAVLSPDYVSALYTQPEWAAAFAADPTGASGKLITVLVRACELDGLLAQIAYIRLVGLDEEQARQALLAGVPRERQKPDVTPSFPGVAEQLEPPRTPFPGPPNPSRRTTLTPRQQQRFQQLSDHVRKDQELLAEYEDALRYEINPTLRVKYRREIEQLKQTIQRRIEEYNRLGNDVGSQHNDRLIEMGTELRQIDAKVDTLLAGQSRLRDDVRTLRVTIVQRFDAAEARIVTAIVSHLGVSQLESVERVLAAVEARRIDEAELRQTLDAVAMALAELEQLAAPDMAEEVGKAVQLIKDPSVNLAHRLKVAISIIPLVLSYETAIEVKGGLNLGAIWDRLTHRAAEDR